MKKQTVILAGLAVVLLAAAVVARFILGRSAGEPEQPEMTLMCSLDETFSSQRQGVSAGTEVRFPDRATGADGRPVDLGMLDPSVTLVHFVGSTCESCPFGLWREPLLAQLLETHRGQLRVIVCFTEDTAALNTLGQFASPEVITLRDARLQAAFDVDRAGTFLVDLDSVVVHRALFIRTTWERDMEVFGSYLDSGALPPEPMRAEVLVAGVPVPPTVFADPSGREIPVRSILSNDAPTLLWITGYGCEPCDASYEAFAALQRERPATRQVILTQPSTDEARASDALLEALIGRPLPGASLTESVAPESLDQFHAEFIAHLHDFGIDSAPVYYDLTTQMAIKWGMRQVPSVVVVAPDGVVVEALACGRGYSPSGPNGLAVVQSLLD